jgi:O-Antigen ligase
VTVDALRAVRRPQAPGFGPADPGALLATPRTWAVLALGAAAAAAAAAGELPLAAAALFAAGVIVGLGLPAQLPAYLALLLPVGFAHTSVHGVQITLVHGAVIGAAVGYALRLARLRERPDLGAPDLAFAALVAGILLSGAGPVAKGVWLHDVAFWGSLAVSFHCCVRVLADAGARRRLYVALAGVALGEGIYAIVEYARASSSRFFRLGGAVVYPQPQGTLQHPNALGAFLVLALLILLGAAAAHRGRVRVAGLALVVVLLFATAAPFSRGAWVALAGGVLAFVLVQRAGRRYFVGGAAVLAIAVGSVALFDSGPLGKRITSPFETNANTLYGFRATLARKAADVIADHPLTGAGRFLERGIYAGQPTVATHPHDLLLGVAVFFGIPAAVAFTALLWLALRAAWRARSSAAGSLSTEAVGVVAALVALLVDGVFEYPFWNTTLTVETVLLLMLAAALARDPRVTAADAVAGRSILRAPLSHRPPPATIDRVDVETLGPENPPGRGDLR